eukprot:11646433-Prorocentrum_lima.AAC.1
MLPSAGHVDNLSLCKNEHLARCQAPATANNSAFHTCKNNGAFPAVPSSDLSSGSTCGGGGGG